MVQDRSQAIGRALRAGLLAVLAGTAGLRALDFPGPDPGPATSKRLEGPVLWLGNGALEAAWSVAGGRLQPAVLRDRLSGRVLDAPREAFILVFHDGTQLKASRMVASDLREGPLSAQAGALSLAARLPGREVSAVLTSRDGTLRVRWRVELRNGSAYLRQQVAVEPQGREADLARVVLVDHWLKDAEVSGRVAGSPIVSGGFFEGLEHPMAQTGLEMGQGLRRVPLPGLDEDALPPEPVAAAGPRWPKAHAQQWLELALPLAPGRTFTVSSVLGVAPAGQLRRTFLHYLERERAHAFRPFLHYNSWYDIGYFTPYGEKDCLGVIKAFGEQLVRARGVTLDSFLFDDGWDDVSRGGRWAFHAGFPRGFLPLKEATAAFGAAPGVWLSPWGGYGKPRIARRRSGQAAGYETVRDPAEPDAEYGQRFALSGSRYYASFHAACLDLVARQGVNQFKLDGTGSLDQVVPGSRFGSDFEAAIALIGDLRRARPDLFVNLTTGTWPSPFWLGICDSIWRGGEDHAFEGPGPERERWITYRDADTWARIVQGGPLFPLNSLMLHGILYARHAKGLSTDPSGAFPHEVRSYFGSGTQLQELYVSHELLSPADWDELARAARWARAQAATLVDTHWVGGSPRRLEVYGWAAWSREKGLLTLRNPSDGPQAFTLDLAQAFELPAGAPETYTLKAPFPQRDLPELAGPRNAFRPVKLTLRPFEVVVLEAAPVFPSRGL